MPYAQQFEEQLYVFVPYGDFLILMAKLMVIREKPLKICIRPLWGFFNKNDILATINTIFVMYSSPMGIF